MFSACDHPPGIWRTVMSEVVRNVTIYMDTQKRMAKRFKVEEFEQRGRGKVVRVHFMEKGARTRWWQAEASSLVIIDGWDHPEFYWLIRGFRDAPSQQLSAGVTVKTLSLTMGTDEPVKSKYELEFEAYIQSLDPTRILFKHPQDG
jgi:hypothetical protein